MKRPGWFRFAYDRDVSGIDQSMIPRRSVLVAGAVLGVGAAAGLSLSSPQPAAAWGGYKNGEIPASALSPIPWAPTRLLQTNAREALSSLNGSFRSAFGRDLPINDAYRDYAGQQEARNYWCSRGACGNAAVPGTSNHGWGLAIDIGVGISDWRNSIYVWMKNNAPRFSWIHPGWAEPGGAHPEAWHWEYVGSLESPPPSDPQPENNPAPKEEDDMANVITVSVPDGSTGNQVYWSVNLAENTMARIWNGTQLDFRRNLGIPEYVNQAPAILQGLREITTT